MKDVSNLLTVGKITGVFGIKGWLKVKSFTEPQENLTSYSQIYLLGKSGARLVKMDQHQWRQQGLIVHFPGIDDRDDASSLVNYLLAIDKSVLPGLTDGDYYWHQLVGLQVISEFEQKEYLLGEVAEMMETGANDVLVVKPTDGSVDQRSHLVPFVPGLYVVDVDLEASRIRVSWDPTF